jgi:hypothetical protein
MPTFRGIAEYAAEGCLVKPLFNQFILDPSFKFEFNLYISHVVNREPDGWFHASTHPTASTRELWLYLARPHLQPPRQMDYAGRMATLFGTTAHGLIEAFLNWMGVMVPLPEGDCPACGRPYKPPRARQSSKWCMEHGAVDLETRSRCHMDGILNFTPQGVFGFDFKTIYTFGLSKCPDMDQDFFREKWPRYYAQMQECMRLSGLRRYIVLFLTMGTPWETREYHLDYDPEFAERTREKYLRVISCVERGLEILR